MHSQVIEMAKHELKTVKLDGNKKREITPLGRVTAICTCRQRCRLRLQIGMHGCCSWSPATFRCTFN